MKKIFLLIFFAFAFIVFTPKIYAENKNFDISANTNIVIAEDGTASVTQTIKIINRKEFIFTPTYTAFLGYKNISNIQVSSSSGSLQYKTLDNNEKGKEIEITFSKKTVGVGNENAFTIYYQTNELAKKIGNIWEVNILGISSPEDFSEYQVSLSIPKNFGKLSLSKPYKFIYDSSQNFIFSKNEIGKAGVYLIFGNEQYYKLKLSYHITNANFFTDKAEIALPPNTAYQEVLITDISPRPLSVYKDSDGNWLAQYKLSSSQKLNITANVLVKTYSQPQYSEPTPAKGVYLSELKYWEVTNPKIQSSAKSLKTAQEIYDFVVQKLTYNYSKVSSSNIRLGAVQALAKPNFAVCLEFTDLFIALARATGIQARAVEGYAYTENSKLRPVALAKDILHVWPEYYDEQSNSWVMVDPTWGNTTKGMDYFNTLDFDHIAFVVNGKNSEYPIPAGGYKYNSNAKDVEVSFGSASEFIKKSKSEVYADFKSTSLAGFPLTGYIVIKNLGNNSLQDKNVIFSSSLSSNKYSYHIDSIPPFGEERIYVDLGKTKFLTNNATTVTITFDKAIVTKRISITPVPDNTQLIIIGGIFLATTIISFITIKAGGVYFQRRK